MKMSNKHSVQIHSGVSYEKSVNKIKLHQSARLLIVGHFPGKEEFVSREPFVGAAGKNLLLLMSLVKHSWFKPQVHPYACGKLKTDVGLWKRLFNSKIAILNWHYGPIFKKNIMKPGDCTLRKTKCSLSDFRELLSTRKDIPILILGEPVRRCMLGPEESKENIGRYDRTTFFWYHPDPRNAASGLFWGTTADANIDFKELLKFLKNIK